MTGNPRVWRRGWVAAVLATLAIPPHARASVWCNDRYLTNRENPQQVATSREMELAEQGYLYAVLGARVLQRRGELERHYFGLPARVAESEPTKYASGFEARTYRVFDREGGELQEVVVAFAGTRFSSVRDWITNLSLVEPKQYRQAREYVRSVATEFPRVRLVAAGYSLGGALAAHVAKRPETESLVAAAWVFNPSPRIWAAGTESDKLRQFCARKEVLSLFRWRLLRWLPGFAHIGANSRYISNDHYLVDGNRLFVHSRYVLARDVLHMADLRLWLKNGMGVGIEPFESEPLQILSLSRTPRCRPRS